MRCLIIQGMEPPADEELVARYRAGLGSTEADASLNELFQRHHRRVALWCLRLTGDRESAADLAQEVFLKAFRSVESYRGASRFSTWLYSITRNHCYNEIKARATRPETVESMTEELVDRSLDPYSQVELENSAQVWRTLMKDTLTEVEARVMTLHYGEDVPMDAITRLLNLENPSGAKAYIVSAKRKLAHAVERWKAREEKSRL